MCPGHKQIFLNVLGSHPRVARGALDVATSATRPGCPPNRVLNVSPSPFVAKSDPSVTPPDSLQLDEDRTGAIDSFGADPQMGHQTDEVRTHRARKDALLV